MTLSDNLHAALLENNQNSFWKIWKSNFNNKVKLNYEVTLKNNNSVTGSLTDPQDHKSVASAFVKYFAQVSKIL